jgi:hypothetical protein
MIRPLCSRLTATSWARPNLHVIDSAFRIKVLLTL